MGLARQEYWSGVPLPSLGGINNGPQRCQIPIPDLWINPITHGGVIKGSEDVIKIYGLWNRLSWIPWADSICYTRSFFFFFCIFKNVFIYLFYFTTLYWFCRTLTWICHECTCVPHPEPPSHLPPHPIPLGHPSVPAPSTLYHASNLDWLFISHMILYMFQCHSPKSSHPRPLPQSPKDFLFCCLAYRVIVTIFLNSIYMH